MKILENISLKPLHTFSLESNARYFVSLSSIDSLSRLKESLIFADWPIFVLGEGSNTLFVDNFQGLIIKPAWKGMRLVDEDEKYTYIQVAAGENWHDFVRWTIKQGYTGLENLSLIPGTVGAAPVQNIGAYGVELEERVQCLEAFDLVTGEQRFFDRQQCRFAYRESYFKSTKPERFLICSVTFRLPRRPEWKLTYSGLRERLSGQVLSAQNISDAVIALRREKLPDPAFLSNAGSFFKNPVVSKDKYNFIKKEHDSIPFYRLSESEYKLPAAWLIEQCGLKGQRQGDIGICKQHALVLVNYGGATKQDLLTFIGKIRHLVGNEFGVQLEIEPRII